jgi:tetratricopeptide (TPR) repeat protein
MDRAGLAPGLLAQALVALLLAPGVGATDRPAKLPKGSEEMDVQMDHLPPPSKEKHQTGTQRREEAVKYHIRNLSDKDPEVRQLSAQMLGGLNVVDAVPNLIEALKDSQIYVQIAAHGALNKITGKNFGYANYREWKGWWENNKQELLKKQALGVSNLDEVRAKSGNTQGLIYLNNGDFGNAYRMFLDAVNANPKVPDYRNNLGLAVMELARNDPYRYIDAMAYFQEAMGLDDSLPQPYMNIGSCYARLGKHIEAQNWFRRAIEKDVNGLLWEHCWTLGKELLSKGDFHLAVEYLQQARSKAERSRKYDPRIYRDLALGYYGLDQYHAAFKEIVNLKRLGYDPNPDFEAKVRKALTDQGVDPDKEDQQAIEEQRRRLSDPPPPREPAPPERPALPKEAAPEK